MDKRTDPASRRPYVVVPAPVCYPSRGLVDKRHPRLDHLEILRTYDGGTTGTPRQLGRLDYFRSVRSRWREGCARALVKVKRGALTMKELLFSQTTDKITSGVAIGATVSPL